MRIIVLNLARATARRSKMETQLTALGASYAFLEATDGKTITEKERAWVDHAARRRITSYPLTDNEIGCWLSHRRAMEDLLSSKDEMLAVTEDDARLSSDFTKVLAAIEGMRRPFDFIDLHRNFKINEMFAPCSPLLPGYELGRIGYTHMNMIGYVVSRKGAERFIASAQRFVHAIDKELHRYWANGLDLYGLSQPIATHADQGFSFIDETRGQDRPKDRERYPHADAVHWRLQRSMAKVCDSIRKRLAFQVLKSRAAKDYGG